ncbi:MAG: RICIN domain-containing protein, partial [Treponema sp.]|nr:RICIN domain-containing protein [Treponema sp.]
ANLRENDHYYHFIPLGDGWYKIAFKQSGRLVLDVAGGRNNNGVAIQAYEDNGTAAQRFRFRRTSDGLYMIFTYWGRAISTQRSDAQDGVVHTWEELPDNHRDMKNQLWRLVKP